MSSVTQNNPFDTVKFRLTLFSGAIIAVTILAAFGVLYGYLATALQANVDVSLASEIKEFESIYQTGGMDALRKEVALEEISHGKDEIFVRILDGHGAEIVSSDLTPWGRVAEPPGQTAASAAGRIESVPMPNGTNSARRIFAQVTPGVWALIGVKNDHTDEVLAIYRARCVEVFVISLFACLVGAWIISRRAMRGVEVLTAEARQIDNGSPDWSIPAPGYGREIDELANVLNEMLSRIAALVSESKVLNDNIAHELRSPMTRIRGAAEMILDAQQTSASPSETAASIIEECDSLLALVNSMLAISEMESGIASLDAAPIDLSGLVRETCDLFETAAEDQSIRLNVQADNRCMVRGDHTRLQRVIANILDNALKYTRANGRVTVSVVPRGDCIEVSVEDSGIGIPDHDLDHVFDRFFRGDKSRSLPGNGLGLGMVRAIVQAHGGTVSIGGGTENGTLCRVVLPALQIESERPVAIVTNR